MKTVGVPVWTWMLVESPPMSQRSHIAISGSTAIWLCSLAWSAPSSSLSDKSAVISVRNRVPEALGPELLIGQLEVDQVDRLLVGGEDALVAGNPVGDRELAEAQPDSADLAGFRDLVDEDLGVSLRTGVPLVVERSDDCP